MDEWNPSFSIQKLVNSGFSVKVTCGEVYAAETIKKFSEFNTLPD